MSRIESKIGKLEKMADAAFGGEVSLVCVFNCGDPDRTTARIEAARRAFRKEHGPDARLNLVLSRVPEPLPLPRAFQKADPDS